MNDVLPLSLSPLMSGDPDAAMEVAKQIIGGQLPVDHRLLVKIATDEAKPKWTRIAAIYALGFLGDKTAAPEMREMLGNSEIDVDIRSHAAEALGNIRDRSSIKVLKSVLRRSPPGPLEESCNYALSEMGA